MTRTEKEQMPRAPRSRADFVCDWGGGQLAVRIRGEIDHHTAVEVRQGIDTLLFERRPRRLLLDLSAVSFMDSSGLGLIMGRLSVMRELGGELVVWNPSREVLRIVTLAGMERLVRIEYPSDRAPDRASASPVAPTARHSGRAASAPETRQNPENHRERDRAATAQNRGSTATPKAPNRAKSTKIPRRDPASAPAVANHRCKPTESGRGMTTPSDRTGATASIAGAGTSALPSSRGTAPSVSDRDAPADRDASRWSTQRKEKDT